MKRIACLLALLIILSPVALAGHTAGGSWCEPCLIGCILDPGEACVRNRKQTDKEKPKAQPEGEQAEAWEILALLLAFGFLSKRLFR